MRAVADANLKTAEVTIDGQRNMAGRIQKSEAQRKISEAINNSVKDEEQKVIDAANKRMGEVHAKRTEEANKAVKAIEDAQKSTESKVE